MARTRACSKKRAPSRNDTKPTHCNPALVAAAVPKEDVQWYVDTTYHPLSTSLHEICMGAKPDTGPCRSDLGE